MGNSIVEGYFLANNVNAYGLEQGCPTHGPQKKFLREVNIVERTKNFGGNRLLGGIAGKKIEVTKKRS